MQTPVIIFDHVNKVVLKAEPGRPGERKLEEIAAAQHGVVATGDGRPEPGR